jgi:ElaB/YqjD/DUF883 family membrane-anchored ribosome-binding protein
MGQDQGQVGEDVEPRDPEQIKKEIEETREELGDTVAAVAEKADVKKQAKAKVADVKQQAAEKVSGVKEKAAGTKEQVSAKAQEATPETAAAGARQTSQQVAQVARENPIHAAAGTAFALGLVIGWLYGRR